MFSQGLLLIMEYLPAHSFLYNSATIGMEFIHNYLIRIYKMYAGIGRYAKHTTKEDFYLGMINTSMACWMNLETGHLEFQNMRLCYNTSDVMNITYCRIELNHDTKVFVSMSIVHRIG